MAVVLRAVRSLAAVTALSTPIGLGDVTLAAMTSRCALGVTLAGTSVGIVAGGTMTCEW